MDDARRHFVAGAAALAALGPGVVRAQDKRPSQAAQIPTPADPTDFEAALRAAFAHGDVLNWAGGNVRLKRPIAIDVARSLTTAGVDLNGAKIVADFNDAIGCLPHRRLQRLRRRDEAGEGGRRRLGDLARLRRAVRPRPQGGDIS